MLDEKLGMGREGKTLKKSLTLSDRDRFRKKSLWIATEEDYHSRSQPDYSIEMTEPLPAHALESSQYASGGIGVFLTQQGSPVLRDLVDRPGAGGQVKESNSSAHKKQATQVQGRGDVGFMSSHPFNAAASTQPRAGQHVERAGLFMRSSNKYAPNGELSKKLGSQRNSISVTSLSVLNHTV